jgi:uncharacterized protein
MEDHFIIHIETCAMDAEGFQSLEEEEQKKLMNPMDSKIVAIGIRHRGQNLVSMEKAEKDMLKDFWNEWELLHKANENVDVVGFNITSFDLPFITARSFIHDVPISPFILKNVVDLREKINAYRHGPTRGKLTEYAALIGMESPEVDTTQLCISQDFEKLRQALVKDLEIIDKLYDKARRTRILDIKRW